MVDVTIQAYRYKNNYKPRLKIVKKALHHRIAADYTNSQTFNFEGLRS